MYPHQRMSRVILLIAHHKILFTFLTQLKQSRSRTLLNGRHISRYKSSKDGIVESLKHCPLSISLNLLDDHIDDPTTVDLLKIGSFESVRAPIGINPCWVPQWDSHVPLQDFWLLDLSKEWVHPRTEYLGWPLNAYRWMQLLHRSIGTAITDEVGKTFACTQPWIVYGTKSGDVFITLTDLFNPPNE